MNDQNWRYRISVLWIADVAALAAAFVLALLEPGYIQGILNGNLEAMEIDAGVTLLAAFFWLVPILLMVLSLMMAQPVVKWLSVIFGVILGLMNIFDFINQFANFDPVGLGRAIMVLLMAIFPFMIAWFGWKGPQPEN